MSSDFRNVLKKTGLREEGKIYHANISGSVETGKDVETTKKSVRVLFGFDLSSRILRMMIYTMFAQ